MKKRSLKRKDIDSGDAQNRCIWMTAGVISFKLCPFDFDCEHCDFDKAMRSHVGSGKITSKVKSQRRKALVEPHTFPRSHSDSKKPSLFFTFFSDELDKGLYLHPAHLWARQIEGQKWKVGVDNLLAYILPPPAKFEFYDLNKDVFRDQMLGKIVTEAGAVFLTSPLSGQLTQTNHRLAQQPELVQQDPYGEGWLAIIKWSQKHSELENLYTGLTGRRFLENEAQHLNFLLRHRGIDANNIGETQSDGGVRIKYLHQLLPSQVCLRLACELSLAGKQGW